MLNSGNIITIVIWYEHHTELILSVRVVPGTWYVLVVGLGSTFNPRLYSNMKTEESLYYRSEWEHLFFLRLS